MFERFRLSNLSKSYRQRGASSDLARDKKQQRQQCVTVLFLDDITHTFRIDVSKRLEHAHLPPRRALHSDCLLVLARTEQIAAGSP